MDRPFYKCRPVGSVKALAQALETTETVLQELAASPQRYYRVAHEIKKSDGSIRTVFSVELPLKAVQKRIKSRFLDNVYYPAYLQGGVRDRENPRDYVRNARIHAGCSTLINEDISNFFPSVSDGIVFDIWAHFFKFPRSVAEMLTKLTVKDGCLPQGTSTSSYLANLVFWRAETRLVDKLRSWGFSYTRYVDDISVSSSIAMKNEYKGKVISLIREMAMRSSLHLKARKQRIYSSGERMLVNNVIVNKKTSVPSEERARIRAAVHQCELFAMNDGKSKELSTLLRSTKGRVRHLARFHPKEATTLMNRLTRLPTFARLR